MGGGGQVIFLVVSKLYLYLVRRAGVIQNSDNGSKFKPAPTDT